MNILFSIIENGNPVLFPFSKSNFFPLTSIELFFLIKKPPLCERFLNSENIENKLSSYLFKLYSFAKFVNVFIIEFSSLLI